MKLTRGSAAFASLALLGAVLAGCGSDSLDDGAKKAEVTSGVDAAAAALVPQAIKDKGTLVVGTDASYAPNEFFAGDGKTIQGFDIDLLNAVAATLDLKLEFKNSAFDQIIGNIGTKYDLAVSSFSINPDRLKVVNMVSYFSAGTQWATAKGNPKNVDPSSPCGLTVGVQKGTVQIPDLEAKAKACKTAGNPIKTLVYERQDVVTAAVVSGKADAMLADSPVVAYAVKQSADKLEAVGDVYDSAPYGIVVPKADTGLADAIAAALKVIAANGDYQKVMDTWGVNAGAVTDFAVNPTS